MNRLKEYVKGWFGRKEEVLPGFTYFALGFWLLCFYTPVLTPPYLGEWSRLADFTVLAFGAVAFFGIYRKELRDAFMDRTGVRA